MLWWCLIFLQIWSEGLIIEVVPCFIKQVKSDIPMIVNQISRLSFKQKNAAVEYYRPYFSRLYHFYPFLTIFDYFWLLRYSIESSLYKWVSWGVCNAHPVWLHVVLYTLYVCQSEMGHVTCHVIIVLPKHECSFLDHPIRIKSEYLLEIWFESLLCCAITHFFHKLPHFRVEPRVDIQFPKMRLKKLVCSF